MGLHKAHVITRSPPAVLATIGAAALPGQCYLIADMELPRLRGPFAVWASIGGTADASHATGTRGPLGNRALVLQCMTPFELVWRDCAKTRMTPDRVIPALDKLEDRHTRLGLGRKAAAIERLALQRREESLAHRVVVGIAHCFHGRMDLRLLTPQPEGNRGVMRTVIGVVHDALGAPAVAVYWARCKRRPVRPEKSTYCRSAHEVPMRLSLQVRWERGTSFKLGSQRGAARRATIRRSRRQPRPSRQSLRRSQAATTR